jgi:methionine--tRNA ligase beta chain
MDMIKHDDFAKLDIRIVTVESAEEVPGSEKLLKITVNAGEEKRTLMAGIKKHYAPEKLIGRQIAILFNLEPRKIFGIESHGMILAAEDDGGTLSVLSPDREMGNGAKVK